MVARLDDRTRIGFASGRGLGGLAAGERGESGHAMLIDLMPMGRVTLRGRAQPVDAFTVRPDLTPEQRARIAELVTAHGAGNKKIDRHDARRPARR